MCAIRAMHVMENVYLNRDRYKFETRRKYRKMQRDRGSISNYAYFGNVPAKKIFFFFPYKQATTVFTLNNAIFWVISFVNAFGNKITFPGH